MIPVFVILRLTQIWRRPVRETAMRGRLMSGAMVVATALAVGAPAQADVTYYYTGDPYTTISDSAFGTQLNGYITYSDVPTCTGPDQCSSGVISDWSFTSGIYTLNPTIASLTVGMAFLTYPDWDYNDGGGWWIGVLSNAYS